MTAKQYKTDTIARKAFSKEELRYCNERGWHVVTEGMLPAGTRYHRVDGRIAEIQMEAAQADLFGRNFARRVRELRRKMPADLAGYFREVDAERRKAVAAGRKAQRERDAIDAMLRECGLYGLWTAINTLRTGDNTDSYTARYGDSNGIQCEETTDYNGYSRRCRFPKVSRTFTLTIRRGWKLYNIGGLLTFVRGGIVRTGQPCEWIEQGRCIADIRTVKGYLVRGEHIYADDARTLKEAQALNAGRRAMLLARVLEARRGAVRRAELKAAGKLRVTFQDSLAAGNCRAGTQEFRNRYEAEVGRKVRDISVADLRKYGKLFGVEYYAERAIEYAMGR